MSITLIAIVGILVGFLCLVIGFFMEDAKDLSVLHQGRTKRSKPMKKKGVVQYKKAA